MSKNTDLGSLVNYIKGQVTGRLNAPAYTSATAFTGTIAGYLGFDTSGNILTSAGVGFTGSGTTNYISKFTGSTSLGNSLIFDNGTNIGIGTTSPSTFLHIVGANTLNRGQLSIQSNNVSNAARVTWYYDTAQQGEIATNGADFYALATNNLLFFAGGAERMRILSTGAATFTSGVTAQSLTATNGNDGVLKLGGAIYFGTVTHDASITGANIYNVATASGGGHNFQIGSTERMRLDSSGRFGLGTTSTSGYAMTVTGVDGTNYSPSALYKIITRFVNNTTDNKGIGIGYHTLADINAACIYGLGQGSDAYPNASIAFAVYNRAASAYAIKFLINQNTVTIVNIPTDIAGRSSGELYKDALGYVKIA